MSDDLNPPAITGRPTPSALGPSPTPAALTPAATTPTPTPAPTPARIPAPSGPTRPPTDPSRWGRIDPDGNAYLTTPDGEVLIGQWAAGTPEEGLAFFGRKFDDLMIEADLARTRLVDGRATPDQTTTAVEHLRSALATPLFMGDITELRRACDDLDALIVEQRAAVEQRRAEAREKARERREEIIVEAEKLATSTQWKVTGDRFTALLEEWKAAPRIDRSTEQALWKRFPPPDRPSIERAELTSPSVMPPASRQWKPRSA